MQKTLAEIAKLINGEVVGDENLIITGINGIKEAKSGDLSFVANSKYFPLIDKTNASAVIAPRDLKSSKTPIIQTDNPSLAFANTAALFCDDMSEHITGVHETAIIADDAIVGDDVSIGPYTVVESKAKIGDGSVIYGGCFIGHGTEIGKKCFLYPNITILARVVIGNNVMIHSGTVIGSDGFGFVSVQGVHEKIPQIGTVVIEDNVEIGANVTIDRARFDKTVIGKGTKIDNLVQIAHNVIVGENCIIVSQSGISGSSILENGVILAGQAGIAGHLTIGENSIVASKSGVPKSIPPNTTVFGYPAKPHAQAMRINACITRLPILVKTVNELKEKIAKLEDELKKNEVS